MVRDKCHSHGNLLHRTRGNIETAKNVVEKVCNNEPDVAVYACRNLGHNYLLQLLEHMHLPDPCHTKLALCGGKFQDGDMPVLPGSLNALGLGVDIRGGIGRRPYDVMQQSFPVNNHVVSTAVTGKRPPLSLGGAQYYYPDTMDCKQESAGQIGTTTASNSNSQSMINDVFTNAKLDINAAAIKLDLGVQVKNDKDSMDRTAHTHSQSTATVNTVQCGLSEFPALDSNFSNHVLELPAPIGQPSPWELQQYDDFFNTWGTHYISQVRQTRFLRKKSAPSVCMCVSYICIISYIRHSWAALHHPSVRWTVHLPGTKTTKTLHLMWMLRLK